MEQEQRFESWCIVELFGHQKLAGMVAEAQIGGCSFIRVDVPEVHDQPAFTRFYGEKAIYSITPVSEEVARAAMGYMRVRPVATYMLPGPAPPPDAPDAEDGWPDEDEEMDVYRELEEDGVPF